MLFPHLLFGSMLLVSLVPIEVHAQAKPSIKGSLIIAGGQMRYYNQEVWESFVKLAGGKGASIAVIPAASSSPEESGQTMVDLFTYYGAKPVLLPIAPRWKGVDCRQAVRDPVHVQTLRKAGGIWFTGGSQLRITDSFFAKDGSRSPALEAIWKAYEEGAVVGGSSAGAAIMSEWMFANPRDTLGTLQLGVKRGEEVAKGLGFLGKEWFVDQHFLTRGRFARSLVAMRELGYKAGIGIDEDTAVLVKDGAFEVLGANGGAVMLDLHAAESDTGVVPFQMKRAGLTYLESGDRLDMHSYDVSLAKRKLEGWKIDPQDPSFKPEKENPTGVPDILGREALYYAMINALQSRSGVVKGLVLSPESGNKSSGFEIKVYRAKDARGWYAARGGHQYYTITNMLVDILPVEMMADKLYHPVTPIPRYDPLKKP